MFRIVVLHEAVIIWIDSLDEWHQVFIQYLTIHLRIHDSTENAGLGCPIPGDTSPHMHFHRMFWAGFMARFLTVPVAAKPSVCFRLNGRFVGPNNIIEIGSKILLRPEKPLFSVLCADKLTVGGTARCPA